MTAANMEAHDFGGRYVRVRSAPDQLWYVSGTGVRGDRDQTVELVRTDESGRTVYLRAEATSLLFDEPRGG